jgi:hypothetical protein
MLAVAIVALGVSPASADTIAWGIPVAAAGSNTQVGLPIQSLDATPDGINNPTGNWVKYFIPLSLAKSGTYGVDDLNGPDPCETPGTDCAGTVVDSGSGNSYLDMFLKFAPVAPSPIASARLEFEFADLDLKYVNDPSGFFESLQIFNSTGTAMTPLLTKASSTVTSGTTNGINWELSRTAGSAGANWPVYLDLWGDGLAALINGPLWVEMNFAVPAVAYGTNTAEYLNAKLTTSSVARVPEPASVWLIALGLVALSIARRRAPQPEAIS